MALITLNNRAINRSDTASANDVWTATSATATDFQAAGGGIENATLFRMTSDFTSDVDPVVNWEVSFPATGYWLVQASAGIKTGDTSNQDMTFSIATTINNSSYVNQTMGFVGPKGNGARLASYNSAILDVTDVSNVKVRFSFGGISSCTVLGDSSRNETYAIFIKLADT